MKLKHIEIKKSKIHEYQVLKKCNTCFTSSIICLLFFWTTEKTTSVRTTESKAVGCSKVQGQTAINTVHSQHAACTPTALVYAYLHRQAIGATPSKFFSKPLNILRSTSLCRPRSTQALRLRLTDAIKSFQNKKKAVLMK